MVSGRKIAGLVSALAAGVFALAACGSSVPATTILKDGSYSIGEDIATGVLFRDSIAGAAACMYKLEDPSGNPFGVSQTVKDEALEDDTWFAPKSVLSRVTLKPLGVGLPLIKDYTLIVRDCGRLDVYPDATAHAAEKAAEKAEDDEAVNPTTDPAEPVLINVAKAGVYVVGKDIPSGLWGSAYIQNKHMPTADLQAISIDGVAPTLYQSADGREHVSFSGDTTAGGDGQRMKDNAWDFAVALEDGQTVTVDAPLSTPFHHYRSLSS